MKLKKIASLMLAGVMAVSMLAGCNGKTETKPEGEGEGEGTTASGYSAMLGEKAADTLEKADKADLFTFTDNADEQKALEQVIRDNVNQAQVLKFIATTSVSDLAANGDVTTAFEDKAGWTRAYDEDWFSGNEINTRKIGDVWVANGNISMDNVMSTIFETYKDDFKNAADEGTMLGNVDLSYAYNVAVSVVNVPLSAYNEYTGSVNFIAVTVTRTADYV